MMSMKMKKMKMRSRNLVLISLLFYVVILIHFMFSVVYDGARSPRPAKRAKEREAYGGSRARGGGGHPRRSDDRHHGRPKR